MKLKTMLIAALGGIGMLCASQARADTLQVTFAGATLVGSNVTYHYAAHLTPGSKIQDYPGDEHDVVAIYDFEGLVGTPSFTGVAPGAAYTFTSSADGATTEVPVPNTGPGALLGAADLALDDIRFSYTGATIINVLPVNLLVGFFNVTSQYGTATNDTYYSTDTIPTGFEGHFGNVLVARSGGDTSVLPLPTAAMGGVGLMGLLGGIRRRRSIA